MKKAMVKHTVVLGMTLLLGACGGKLSGTYECGHGQKVTFEGGKMKQEMLAGMAVETPVTLDGNEIKVEREGVSSTIYTLADNGCIVGAGGMVKCCKAGDNDAVADEKPQPTDEERNAAKDAAKRMQDSISAAINASMQ